MLGFVKTRVVKTNGDFAVGGRNFANTSQDGKLYINGSHVADNAGGVSFLKEPESVLYYDLGINKVCYRKLLKESKVQIVENGFPNANTIFGSSIILTEHLQSGNSIIQTHSLADVKDFKPYRKLDKIDGSSVLWRFHEYLVLSETKQGTIKCFNLDEDSIVWEVSSISNRSFSETSLLFDKEQRLYFTINTHLIAEIDVRTGEVIRTWSNEYFHNPGYCLRPSEKDTMIRYGERNCLLFNKTRIGLLYSEGYREINLETGEVTQENLRQYFRDERLSPFTNTTIYTHKDLILFSSQYTNAEENRMDFSFGAFDPKTHKVVARYDFAPGEVGRGIKGPVANDQQVFILDFNNHLHLFDIV